MCKQNRDVDADTDMCGSCSIVSVITTTAIKTDVSAFTEMGIKLVE